MIEFTKSYLISECILQQSLKGRYGGSYMKQTVAAQHRGFFYWRLSAMIRVKNLKPFKEVFKTDFLNKLSSAERIQHCCILKIPRACRQVAFDEKGTHLLNLKDVFHTSLGLNYNNSGFCCEYI